MAKVQYVKGSTDVILTIFIQDSSSTTGTGLTGLVFNSAGLSCYYVRPGSTAAVLTLATQTVTGAHSDGGFVEIDATNMPGWYRLDLSDAIVATGVNSVGVNLKGATNMAPLTLEIQLTDFDLNDSVVWGNFSDQYNGTGIIGDTFPSTQSQLSGLANVGSAVNRPAASYTLTTGTQTGGTFATTEELDGVYHIHTDSAGAMELYYEFLIGAGIPSSAQVTGYLTGNNDDLDVFGYDWVAASWKQIGNLQGTVLATDQVNSYDMFVNMVGTGVDSGKVRIRFYKASGLTAATLGIDQIFVSFSQSQGGYEGAAIWYNSSATNTNTVVGVDGTASNPVSSEVAVNTLLAATNFNTVEVKPGSTITFATSHANENWRGSSWTAALGGQDLSGATIQGATLSGIATGSSDINLQNCNIGTCTFPPFHANECGLSGTITFSAAGSYLLNDCHSRIAGGSTPVIDTGAAIANVNLAMPEYWNGIEIRNLNATGTDEFSISGTGQIIYAASSSGTVNQRGSWKITNTGGVTIVYDDVSDKADSLTFTLANQIDSNIISVSSDSAAADNLESQYDGTGLSGDSFPATQAQVGAITVTGAALNQAAESYVLTTGAQTANTFSDTGPLDGVRHTHIDAAGAMELYYQFDIGSEGVPATYTETGYLTGGNDTLGVYAYNWGAVSWEQIGSFVGSGSTTNVTNSYALYTSHVGTGADLGTVRIRYFAASGLTTATLALDQIYVSYASVPVSRQTKGTVSDVSPSSTSFDTDLTQATGLWNDALLIFTSGVLANESRPITVYTSVNGNVSFDEAFISAPANGDSFIIYHTHIHPVSQIQNGLATQASLESQSIKKNAIFNNFEFIMVLSADGRTPATGLTVSGTRSIDGGAFASITGVIAEVANGVYQLDATAADTNGDVITWRFSAATAEDTFVTFKTVS